MSAKPKKKSGKKKPKTAFLSDIKGGKGKKKLKKSKDECKESGEAKKLTESQALKEFGNTVAQETFRGQLVFFLNAMWKEHSDDAPKLYDMMLTLQELARDGKQGEHDLDDFQAARFLEKYGETMTVIERRKALKEIDLDNNNRMGMLEYLVFRYKTKVQTLMNRPQGTNKALKNAEKALMVVMGEIETIETKKAVLQNDIDNGKGLASIKAKAELAQLEDADPLPLNRALITAEAAVRKCQKSKSLFAMGKKWVLQHELAEAKKYKPKGGIKKARFSISK